ncbi:abortive infection system toxin AbiGii family protein [Virgibacillus halodenitrificans]|nr:abortive infection system toxin AbiGii family protein [Virgibacillus halodenitrificans]
MAQLLKQVTDMAGTTHPLYPHYRYKPVQLGDRYIFEHEPLTQEAREKYPLSYRGKFKIKKDKSKDFDQLLDEAYIKQEDIEINMLSFQAWLGENEVPTPEFDEAIKEWKWVIAPDPLPKPMGLKVSLKSESDCKEITLLDYLELNICDVDRRNNLYTLDNSKHVYSKLHVALQFRLGKPNVKIDIKIKPDLQRDLDANYSLLSFFKTVSEKKGSLIFKNLQTDTDFIVANKFEFNGSLEKLEGEYRLINRLLSLEKNFDVKFRIPEKFDKEDWESIQILESIVEDKPVQKTIKDVKVDCTERKALLDLIQVFEPKNQKGLGLKVTATGKDARIELFDAVIPLEKVETTYNCLKMKNIEKMRRKARDMEDGELVKVTLVPGADKVFKEKYFVKETLT